MRPGRVTKILRLVDGHNAVYSQHILEGFTGKMCLGHHATLDPHGEGDTLRISTSPSSLVLQTPISAGRKITESIMPWTQTKLSKNWKKSQPCGESTLSMTDYLSRRRGFVDIVQVYAKKKKKPGWVCAVYPKEGFLWYALKDSHILPSTVIWMENHGRHYSPWNGRNCCIGLEDVCAYLSLGLRDSCRKNRASEKGIPTYLTLSEKRPTMVNYIEGAAKIPKGFDKVRKVKVGQGEVTFLSYSEKSVTVPLFPGSYYTGSLEEPEEAT